MNKNKSQISYWYEDECILTVPTHSVPHIGEEIHIDNKWTFVVTHIKRYYKKTLEEFEVYLENKI